MSWHELSEWWINEVADDPAYEGVVTPLLLEILQPEGANTYLDLGCGEGRVMKSVSGTGAMVIGVELVQDLASAASNTAPTVIGELPELSYFRPDSVDGAYCVLVLEHIEDIESLFASVGRVVSRGGVFALVANHPIWTAPGSTPITDVDGETLWRSGGYFSGGFTDEPAGESAVRFHHRSMSDLLNSAAQAGWSLEKVLERPHHEVEDQPGIPRLLACRWRLLP